MSTRNYELIGIVIHSGQANAGHYYSFIKNTQCNNNQWYRFNDTLVEEIQLTEQMLEEECFGGIVRSEKDNMDNSRNERIRFWNAYMLIYQCIKPTKLNLPTSLPIHMTPHDTRRFRASHHDSLQIKNSSISSNILKCVKDKNLELLKDRDTYCNEYFQFIYRLSNICLDQKIDLNMMKSYELCTKLALNFLINTYFRAYHTLRKDNLEQWMELLFNLFTNNSLSCDIFYQLLLKPNENILKLYLLDCPIDDIRQIFEQICEYVIKSSCIHDINNQYIERFIEQLILLLDKSIFEQVKHSKVYFHLIYWLANLNQILIEYLLKFNAFKRLMNFLLGEEMENRRWNSEQAKEFGIVYEITSILALYCFSIDKTKHETHIKFIHEIETYFFGKWSNRYLKEICNAFQEVLPTQLSHTLQLMEMLAEDEIFSKQFLRIILQSITQAHTNGLNSLFTLLSRILLIEDLFQMKRLQMAFEGINEPISADKCQHFNGLYTLIRTNIEAEQRRTYQIIKLLITLSNKSSHCKDYFSLTVNQWETAISWLKQQMQASWRYPLAVNASNEDNNETRFFQRTRSAQFTFEQAQFLLQHATIVNRSTHNGVSTSESTQFNDNQVHSSSQLRSDAKNQHSYMLC